MVEMKCAVREVESKVERIERGGLTEEMEESIRTIIRNEIYDSDVQQKIDNFQQILQNTDAEKLSESCKNLETVHKFMDDKAKEQRREDADRARKQTNLVIFKVPESKAKEGIQRKKEDEEKVKQIMEEIKAQSVPNRVIRLKKKGNKSKDQNCRPILVKFDCQSDRDNTLRKFASAKRGIEEDDEDDGDEEEDQEESEDEKLFRSISMRRDMTIQELREDNELFEEWKRKKDESKNLKDPYAFWIRRDGKVINIGRYPRRGGQQMQH